MPPRFLCDENVPLSLAKALRAAGFDVLHISKGMTGLNDGRVLEIAEREGHVLITLDKDFYHLAFLPSVRHAGIALLRYRGAKPHEVKERFLVALQKPGLSERLAGNVTVFTNAEVRVHHTPEPLG